MLSSILTALGSLAAIVGAGYGIFRYIAWKAQTTPAQADANIDAEVAAEKQAAEQSGRPQ